MQKREELPIELRLRQYNKDAMEASLNSEFLMGANYRTKMGSNDEQKRGPNNGSNNGSDFFM